MIIRILGAAMLVGCAHLAPDPNETASLLVANVTRISEEYANINTDLSGKMLARRGIVLDRTFKLRHKDRTLRARLSTDYGDVERGEWVALIEDDGNLQIAISFGHAATELGCVTGDTLYITPLAP